ncbi:hypothetical protein PC121_g21456 [Phytophthora cactorum]|nr:hypothetical protein PC121_g21456 [Phytophthora cactorum]
MVIHPPNQFETILFLHEMYPDIFSQEVGKAITGNI